MITNVFEVAKKITLDKAVHELAKMIRMLDYKILDERAINYGYQFKIANEGIITIYQRKGLLSKVNMQQVQPRLANIIFDFLEMKKVEEISQEIFDSYIGTDESGKGDVFGPIVVAGICVNEETKSILKKIKVSDCKQNSDKKNEIMAKQIYELIDPKYYSIITVPLKKYNLEFDQINNNLAKILANMHGSAIKNISNRVECKKAIIDRFDNSPNLENRLVQICPNVQFTLLNRAERFMGVAAASVIARVEYLKNMKILSNKAGFQLHKGASNLVKNDIEKLYSKFPDNIDEFCKMHFKTISDTIND